VSHQKEFYIGDRKPIGIYYYIFIVRDPVTRKTIAYKSTETTDKKQSEAIGLEYGRLMA